MLLRVNQVAFGLGAGVLGASGNRMCVWPQGCSLKKCPGCSSMHTWPTEGGKQMSIELLLGLARAQKQPPSGLTLSGGEPTDQAESVGAFIKAFRVAFPGTEVVLYTGLRWSEFAARFPSLLQLLDVAVAGPYVRTRQATALAGSSNQEVHLLTPLARRLYRDWENWSLHELQVGSASAGKLVTVGIPNTQRMTKAAQHLGAVNVTWDQTGQEMRA